MKKRLTVLFATMLCVCSLLLAACGGTTEEKGNNAEPAEASQEEAGPKQEEPEPEPEPDPSEKFIGEWVLAGMTSEGMTIVGDFQSMSTEDGDMTLTIKEDGTANMSFDAVSSEATWKVKGEDTLVLSKPNASDDKADDADDADDDSDADENEAEEIVDELGGGLFESRDSLDVVYRDGYLDIPIESDGFTGDLNYSKDGTIKEMPILNLADATDFKTAEQLVGEWTAAAMVANGVTMYSKDGSFGEDDGSVDSRLLVSDDGTLQFMGTVLDWTLDGDGARITDGGSSGSIPIKLLHGMAVIDMTEASGAGELMMAYRK